MGQQIPRSSHEVLLGNVFHVSKRHRKTINVLQEANCFVTVVEVM